MDLKKATELVKFDLESSNIIIVLSNKSVWNLENEIEIEAVKNYALNNKLEMFIVKNEATKEVVKVTKKSK